MADLRADRPDLIPALESVYTRLGAIFRGAYNLNLFGVRGTSRIRGLRNDAIGCLFDGEGGERHLWLYRGSTDPGVNGIGILAPGRYPGLWSAGPKDLHKGRYRAFVQRGPCRIYYDADGDDLLDLDPATIVSGAGYNLHHDYGEERLVESTLGCQVVRRSALAELLSLVDLQAAHGRGWRCSYVLLEARTHPDLTPILDAAGGLL